MRTDNEIVKALECCMGCACKECPYDGDAEIEAEVCMGELVIDALKLINRQKEEIERLQKRRKEEIENLVQAIDKVITEAKAEAIKEFGAKFAKAAVYFYITRKYEINEDDLNRITKELTEENCNG